MKVNTALSDTEVADGIESTDFEMDKENTSMMFTLLSDKMYSNKIGSIVREVTSNCFDSHIEAGVDQPVVIRFIKTKNNEDSEGYGDFVFQDFGVGISPDRMKNIVSKYGASTKRHGDNEIGGFGLGFKSPWAYSDSFQVITRYEGIEYHYILYKGQKAPGYSVVSKKETEKENGTKVVISVKTEEDYLKFIDEMKKQLKYFDQILYIDIPEIDSDFKLFKLEHLIGNSVDADVYYNGIKNKNISLCLGKVNYPIDQEILRNCTQEINLKHGEPAFNLYGHSAFALKFDIGEIDVTPNREQLEYTDKTISAIKEKLVLAWKEIKEICSENIKEKVSLENYLNLIQENKDSITINSGDQKYLFKVGFFINAADVETKDLLIEGFDYRITNKKLQSVGNLKSFLFHFHPTKIFDGVSKAKDIKQRRRGGFWGQKHYTRLEHVETLTQGHSEWIKGGIDIILSNSGSVGDKQLQYLYDEKGVGEGIVLQPITVKQALYERVPLVFHDKEGNKYNYSELPEKDRIRFFNLQARFLKSIGYIKKENIKLPKSYRQKKDTGDKTNTTMYVKLLTQTNDASSVAYSMTNTNVEVKHLIEFQKTHKEKFVFTTSDKAEEYDKPGNSLFFRVLRHSGQTHSPSPIYKGYRVSFFQVSKTNYKKIQSIEELTTIDEFLKNNLCRNVERAMLYSFYKAVKFKILNKLKYTDLCIGNAYSLNTLSNFAGRFTEEPRFNIRKIMFSNGVFENSVCEYLAAKYDIPVAKLQIEHMGFTAAFKNRIYYLNKELDEELKSRVNQVVRTLKENMQEIDNSIQKPVMRDLIKRIGGITSLSKSQLKTIQSWKK